MPLSCFAITTPGIEALTARELTELGVPVTGTEPGGVSFETDADGLARANLWLRTASRVLVRVAEFHAYSFAELERHARKMPWEDFLAEGVRPVFRVTSKKSKLYHQDAIAERLERWIGREVSDDAPEQLFIVRVHRDRVTISADASGELLHRRGYRLEAGKAPLRETLAAAMLLAIGWDGTVPLVDPFAGSGTIPIEGALIARGMAPGAQRGCAMERWPAFGGRGSREVEGARGPRPSSSVPRPLDPSTSRRIIASDRDAGAVAAMYRNAERAGVADALSIRQAVISDLELPATPGWIVTNPPYGVRVGERQQLRDLYAQFGHVLRARAHGWKLALLSTHPALDHQLGLPLTPLWQASNGGITVRLVTSSLP
ncbi:MAG TPA: class I SAM-dependent RNA methyltransferase [Gemmatimonadales bacterium]|jgi:putative N6-adenine-specific DNA methylase|nr:class I SAM-dependent RNA methyltransferase [Gemmatimonadales bacterium]